MSGEPRPSFGKAGTPASPAGPDPAGAPGADPSMEDILASIRRILNEEETAPPGTPAEATGKAEPGAATPQAPPADDALDLSEDMLVAEPQPAPASTAPAANPPPNPPAAPPPPPQPAAMALPAPVEPAPAATEGLLAPAAVAATTASLGALLRTVAQERSSAVHRGGPTIEDVVREEIRPMLKEWLDQHLPPLVERLVRAEIERVVGRALS